MAEAEPSFLGTPLAQSLAALGHPFVLAPSAFTPQAELGAVAALERRGEGAWQAVAEPTRRGGGSARVVHPGA